MRLRSLLTRSLAIAFVVGLGACSWPMAGQGPDRRSWSQFDSVITPANVAGLTPGWTATGDQFAGEVVGDGGVVYQSDGSGVRALDLGTGAVLWSNGPLEGSGPIVRSDTLLNAGGGSECFVETRARADGGDLRVVRFGGIPISVPGVATCGTERPLEVGSTIVVSHGAWALDQQSTSCGGGRGYKSTREITAFDATLAVLWNYQLVLSSGCGRFDSSFPGAAFGDIASDGTRVFAIIPSLGTVQAFPLACAASCTPSWTRTLPNQIVGRPLVLTNGGVAVSDTTGVVTILDPTNGTTLWSTASGASTDGMAATATSLFVPRQNGQLTVYATGGCGQNTCGTTWAANLGHTPLGAAPSVSGDVLWVADTDKTVVALDARGCGTATCSSLDTLTTTANIGAAPVVVSGRLLVRTATGGLETFALSN
jgi:outer membrane protein assembly factor BamB